MFLSQFDPRHNRRVNLFRVHDLEVSLGCNGKDTYAHGGFHNDNHVFCHFVFLSIFYKCLNYTSIYLFVYLFASLRQSGILNFSSHKAIRPAEFNVFSVFIFI